VKETHHAALVICYSACLKKAAKRFFSQFVLSLSNHFWKQVE